MIRGQSNLRRYLMRRRVTWGRGLRNGVNDFLNLLSRDYRVQYGCWAAASLTFVVMIMWTEGIFHMQAAPSRVHALEDRRHHYSRPPDPTPSTRPPPDFMKCLMGWNGTLPSKQSHHYVSTEIDRRLEFIIVTALPLKYKDYYGPAMCSKWCYAKHHDYRFEVTLLGDDLGTEYSWEKVSVLREAIHKNESHWVVWMDPDVLIKRQDLKLQEFTVSNSPKAHVILTDHKEIPDISVTLFRTTGWSEQLIDIWDNLGIDYPMNDIGALAEVILRMTSYGSHTTRNHYTNECSREINKRSEVFLLQCYHKWMWKMDHYVEIFSKNKDQEVVNYPEIDFRKRVNGRLPTSIDPLAPVWYDLKDFDPRNNGNDPSTLFHSGDFSLHSSNIYDYSDLWWRWGECQGVL